MMSKKHLVWYLSDVGQVAYDNLNRENLDDKEKNRDRQEELKIKVKKYKKQVGQTIKDL